MPGVTDPLTDRDENRSPTNLNTRPVNERILDSDLLNCEDEPIHIPGAIQSHGYLIAFDQDDQHVVAISENLLSKIGSDCESSLSLRLTDFVTEVKGQRIESLFDSLHETPQQFTVKTTFDEADLQLTAHSLDGKAIFEFESMPDVRMEESIYLCKKVAYGAKLLREPESIKDMTDMLVDLIQEITGYERVLAYSFDDNWNGTVISEARLESVKDSFLNQHFPASDIPKQARELYKKNLLRLILNVEYSAVPILPSEVQVDLSHSILRSVSPIHLEYLRNMGVQATLVISIIAFGELWGLIACHDYSPGRKISADARDACLTLSALSGSYIESKVSLSSSIQQNIQSEFLRLFNEKLETSDRGIESLCSDFRDKLAAILNSEDFLIVGPYSNDTEHGSRSELLNALSRLLDSQDPGKPYHTTNLPSVLTISEEALEGIAGVLALHVPELGWLTWLRKEVRQSKVWAGNPTKPEPIPGESAYRLTPRKSFEAWEELVKGQALPFSDDDIDGARKIKQALQDRLLKEAREESSFLASLVAASGDAIVSFSPQGQLLTWNASAEVLLGLNGESIDESHEEQLSRLTSFVLQSENEFVEFDFKKVDGEHRSLLLTAFSLTVPGGEDFRAAIIRDVTSQRKSEEELLVLSQELAEKNELLEDYAWNAAHDLKEPIRVMTTYSMLLDSEDPQDEDEHQNAIATIQKAGREAIDKIDSLLKVTSIEREPHQLEEVSLSELISAIASKIGPEIAEAACELTFDTPHKVRVVKQYLDWALENMILNSIHHKGGEPLVIEINSKVQDKAVHLTVQDNGAGLDGLSEKYIFGLFKRGEGRAGNLGVGLAVAKKGIEASGGRILVDEEFKDGARFVIELQSV